MRIGIDARFYGSLGKGLGRYTEKLIEHLEVLDTVNEYTVFLRPENFEEYVPRNVRFKKVLARYPWYGLTEQTLFVYRLYRERLDLVHFPHFNVPLLYCRPFVVTIHDLILLHYPTLRNTTRFPLVYWGKFLAYRLVIASAVKRARCIITVSNFTKDDLEKKYPHAQEKIVVTYEAADWFCQYLSPKKERALFCSLGLFSDNISKSDEASPRGILEKFGPVLHSEVRPYFLYVGNAYPHKNLRILFDLARAFPTFLLVLVGREDSFYLRLKEAAKREELENIVFTSFLKDSELSSLYRLARMYVFPSLYEGFGLPPLEAMARGTPVLSSNRGSLPEILGKSARYFDPTRVTDLIRQAKLLIEDEEGRQEMVRWGYARVAQFDFRTMASQTLEVYKTSLKNKKHFHVAPSDSIK